MSDDPIVAAVRRVREEIAAKHNYNVAALFRDLRSRELQHGDRLVAHPPIPVPSSSMQAGDVEAPAESSK